MQHDLNDQWRALLADQQGAQAAAARARQELTRRIEQARAGAKGLRPLPEFLEANERAAEAVVKAKKAVERFSKEHPEVE
jgi:hypothetical protein